VDETRSADPPLPAPEEPPAKFTGHTGAIATHLTPTESREYPEVAGYEILGILGHGGMGVVYRARQSRANRLVALKMIRAVEHASPQDRMRFQIETEAVTRLQHPHIVQLYEVGEVRGQPFFSLECSFHFYLDKPSNDLSFDQANFRGNYPFGRALKGRILRRATRVGLYPPNKLGLCDMHGNVWQWTSPSLDTGAAIRGGGWGSGGSECRAAHGIRMPSTFRESGLGFRLARVPVQ
jgi:hypothetical protein